MVANAFNSTYRVVLGLIVVTGIKSGRELSPGRNAANSEIKGLPYHVNGVALKGRKLFILNLENS